MRATSNICNACLYVRQAIELRVLLLLLLLIFKNEVYKTVIDDVVAQLQKITDSSDL